MSAFDAIRYRAGVLRRALFDRQGWRREMDDELAHHLALEEMQQRHAGAGDDDARRAARRRLGDPRRVRERLVDDSGASALDALRQDVRFAWRTLRARPGFTAVAVLTLAIGIGANVAIYSAVDAMLLRRLPFADPDRLMKVSLTRPPHGEFPASDDAVWSHPKYVVFRDAQRAFSDVAIYTDYQQTIRGGGEPERAWGEYVDARYLPTLGVLPALGRNFTAQEDREPGAARVAIISDALWRRRFSADPAVAGRAIDLGGEPYTIVGVAPPRFAGLSGRAEFWLPVLAEGDWVAREAWSHSYTMIARRAPGVSEAQAMEAVRALGARVNQAYPDPDTPTAPHGAIARPLDATRVDPTIRRALLVLAGAVGLVLLIACANVANLLLVRAASRQREIAVRIALGAGRARLVRQLLTESVLLSVIGGAAGLLLAWWAVGLLAAIDAESTLRMQRLAGIGAVNFGSIRLDPPALAFAAALTLGTGILFGLAPALQATRPSLTASLKDGAAGSRGTGATRPGRASLRGILAVSEIALAIVLLAGSGLMLRSLAKLLDVDPGIDARGVLTLRFGAPVGAVRDSMPGFYDRVLERVTALPGVAGAAVHNCPPLGGGCNGTVLARRDRPVAPGGTDPRVAVHWMTPEWPAVMRVPLLRGRLFTDADRRGARKVVLVSATAARRIWPGEDPVGRPVSVGQGGFWDDTATVVGVLGDVRYVSPDAPPSADVYLPSAQSPFTRPMLFVRAARGGDALALAATVRRALADVAPDAPIYDMRTMEERVARAMAFQRFSATMLALFAGVALALATLGVYGVVAFGVTQRTGEIGVRMALGATRADVVRLVVGQGLGIAAAGVAIGLVGAYGATRLLRTMLYDVAPTDPATFAGIVLILGLAVVAASWIPARRAARLPATVALREG